MGVENKYTHLLQPIRDLAENWNIDVAAELEDYLKEISTLEFAFEGTSGTLNFAEAALLIQGSTCIYSKKVEHLYQLVYETLDLLASKKRLAQKSSLENDGEDIDTQDFGKDEEDEFLPLDDIPEDKNIDMKDDSPCLQQQQGIARTPAALLSLGEGENLGDSALISREGMVIGNRSDYKMNTSIVHETGTLLLGQEDAQFLDHSFQRLEGYDGTRTLPVIAEQGEPDMGGPASDNGDDLDPNDTLLGDDFDDFGGMDDNDDDNDDSESVTNKNDGQKGFWEIQGLSAHKQTLNEDIWELLDPHEIGKEKPLPSKKITSYRVPSSLSSSTTAKRKKTTPVSTESIIELCSETSIAARLGSTYKPKAKTAYPEFKTLYDQERKRRQKADKEYTPISHENNENVTSMAAAKAATTTNPIDITHVEAGTMSAVKMAPPEAFEDDSDAGDFAPGFDDDDEFEEVQAVDQPDIDESLVEQMPDFGAAAKSGESFTEKDKDKSMTYEALVREHIDQYLAEAQKYAIESDLSKRIHAWETRIKPVLETEARRKEFDIHAYGKNILDQIPDKKSTKLKKQDVIFEDIVQSKSLYEVSRIFLATLQLANNGNIEICYTGAPGEVSDHTLHLRLLTKDVVQPELAELTTLRA
eukprot:m.63969 g.63969  ORF g.63969 m.63969 type:complete len:642 (+) comp11616_c0_seq1:104-2029(+)